MKKLTALLLCLCLCTGLCTVCFADSIYTPMDSFASSNDCTYDQRKYVPAEGSVAQLNPRLKQKAFELDPAIAYDVTVFFTDKDGVEWGCLEKNNEIGAKSGWIPLSSMSRVYDNSLFLSDHTEDFTPGEGFSPDLSGGAVVYEYPASPHKWIYGPASWSNSYEPDDLTYTYAWVDAKGVTWLYINYYFGITGWICADNPLAGYDIAANTGSEDIVPDPSLPEISGLPLAGEIVLADPTLEPTAYTPSVFASELSDSNLRIFWIALFATLGCTAIAAAIAVVFLRKKKN